MKFMYQNCFTCLTSLTMHMILILCVGKGFPTLSILSVCDMFLSPNCRIAEYHLHRYESAHAAFTQGHQLDGEYSLFWLPV